MMRRYYLVDQSVIYTRYLWNCHMQYWVFR